MLDRYDAVARILAEAPASYAPLFIRTDEGTVLAQDWAAGFLAAIRLRLEAWRPLLDGPAWVGLLLPIQAGDAPVLVRIDTDAGHGLGKPVSKLID